MRNAATRRAFLLALGMSLLGSQALAQTPAPATSAAAATLRGEVMVVLGETEGTSVDPAIEKLAALHKAPFDSFPSKKLLSNAQVSLTIGKEAEVELPNGRKLRLLVIEKTAEGRFRVSISINRPGKQDYLPLMTVVAAPGDPFFIAGQKHQGGTLIIGVTVGKAG